LAAGFYPKNVAFARQIMALLESGWGCSRIPRGRGSYAYESRNLDFENSRVL